MKKIVHKFNNFKKKLIPLISLSFLKKNYKINKFFTKKPKYKISNFNKYLIFLISLLFLYLFYLSLPSLYDKGRLQKDLSDKLLSEFNVNFSLSSDLQYSILPYPHILIKNVKIFNKSLSSPKELIQIGHLLLDDQQYKMTTEAESALLEYINKRSKLPLFANARTSAILTEITNEFFEEFFNAILIPS